MTDVLSATSKTPFACSYIYIRTRNDPNAALPAEPFPKARLPFFP